MNEVDRACRRHGHHTLRGVRANVGADIERYLTMSPENVALGAGFKRRVSAWLRPELLCLTLHRTSHYLHVKGWHRPAWWLGRLNQVLHKADISPASCIGPGCRLPHPPGVSFHGRAGRGLTLFSLAVCCPAEGLTGGSADTGPQLGARVTVGGHATVIGPVRVGDDVKVSYAVRLGRDVPGATMVVSRANVTHSRRATAGSGSGV